MTVDRETIRADVEDLLNEVLADRMPPDGLTPSSTLDELGLESLDLVRLAGRLQARFPAGGNLAFYVSGLPAGGLGELRVEEVVDTLVDVVGGNHVVGGSDPVRSGADAR